MQIEKGFRDNWLQPTGAQEALLRQFSGHKRFVWNRALSMEQARYRRGEKMLGCVRMMRELTMWRNNPDPHSAFLKDAPVHALQCVLWELYESYRKFFRKEQVVVGTKGGRMSRRAVSICFVVASMLPAIAFSQSFLSQYKGLPYHDTRYSGGPQKIPGRVLCAYYDLGGEGVAYHDSDPKNHGSGELNPADGTYLNEFRIHEGVDTSYTKFNRKPEPIDDNPFDKVVPPADLLYVGWTEPGEWFNITVDVTQAGTYAADFLYTSNRGGKISVDVNGKDVTGALQITTTNDPADPVAWRQWHHWNLASQLFKVRLNKGKNVLTVHILTGGNMNLAYFDFKQARR
jgi:hypothetical protein